MSHGNNIIVAPDSIYDVQETIGSGLPSLGNLIHSGKINQWSKYKPVGLAKLFTLDELASDGVTWLQTATWWGQSPSNGVVSGSLTGVGNITLNGNIKNTNNNQMDITVGYSGLRITAGAVTLINPTYGLRIGDALLSWDGQNQCLKISNASNSANKMSVYATGGVSALGYSA